VSTTAMVHNLMTNSGTFQKQCVCGNNYTVMIHLILTVYSETPGMKKSSENTFRVEQYVTTWVTSHIDCIH
jgi:hypothetical protein